MQNHLRANLLLAGLTLVICSVLYPLVLWGIGQAVFPAHAQGSLVRDDSGKVVGSRLIAQSFSGDEYFQPRPSAASYKAEASGASNLAASNPLLRDRVARTLGPIVRYKGTRPHGRTVQEDIALWARSRPNIVAEWADKYPSSAQAWVNADDKHKEAVGKWQEKNPDAVAAWKKDNPSAGEPKAPDLALSYFKSNAAAFHKEWPKLIEDATWSLAAVFFDFWLNEHPQAELEEVPADMVTASASGLDPHITLKNAQYQLKIRVAEARANKIVAAEALKLRKDYDKLDEAQRKTILEQARKAIEDKLGKRLEERLSEVIDALLTRSASAPLGGLVGVPLVNVLEVNMALDKRAQQLVASGK